MGEVDDFMAQSGGQAYVALCTFGALILSGMSETDAWALLSPEQRDAAYHEVMRIKDEPCIERKRGPRSV